MKMLFFSWTKKKIYTLGWWSNFRPSWYKKKFDEKKKKGTKMLAKYCFSMGDGTENPFFSHCGLAKRAVGRIRVPRARDFIYAPMSEALETWNASVEIDRPRILKIYEGMGSPDLFEWRRTVSTIRWQWKCRFDSLARPERILCISHLNLYVFKYVLQNFYQKNKKVRWILFQFLSKLPSLSLSYKRPCQNKCCEAGKTPVLEDKKHTCWGVYYHLHRTLCIH